MEIHNKPWPMFPVSDKEYYAFSFYYFGSMYLTNLIEQPWAPQCDEYYNIQP
jgi:hypothetical protein